GRVAAVPAEGLARGALDSGGVDPARSESLEMRLREIGADDAHDARARTGDERRSQSRVGSGATQHVAVLAAGHIEVVECDRTDDEEGIGAFHEQSLFVIGCTYR